MREASISEQLQRRSIVLVESSLPPHLTLAEWRRDRSVPTAPCRGFTVVRLWSSLGATPSRVIHAAFSLVRSWVR